MSLFWPLIRTGLDGTHTLAHQALLQTLGPKAQYSPWQSRRHRFNRPGNRREKRARPANSQMLGGLPALIFSLTDWKPIPLIGNE